jgi:hypothetical protein
MSERGLCLNKSVDGSLGSGETLNHRSTRIGIKSNRRKRCRIETNLCRSAARGKQRGRRRRTALHHGARTSNERARQCNNCSGRSQSHRQHEQLNAELQQGKQSATWIFH